MRPSNHHIQEWPGTVVHRARGLCDPCYRKHRDSYDRTTYTREELLEEVDMLAGRTCTDIAATLGVSLATIEQAARRAGQLDLARQCQRAYRRQRLAAARTTP